MSEPLTPESFQRTWSGLHHPEDIVWDAEREVLYAGGEAGEIYRGMLDGRVEQVAWCGEGAFVLGIALDADGDLYVCDRGNGRLLRVDATDFGVHEISRGTANRPMVCPNYPAFDATGKLYVTDSGTWGANDGVIYRIDPRTGTSVWATSPSNFTNGIALAPDHGSVVVVESRASRVWRTLIGDDGDAGPSQLIWHEPGVVPDGVAFDAAGALYIGCYTPDSIYVVDPGSGSSRLFAHDWSGQAMQAPTNIAFIGAGLGRLATANLCGWHVNVTDQIAVGGLPLIRPKISSWHT